MFTEAAAWPDIRDNDLKGNRRIQGANKITSQKRSQFVASN